MAAFLYRCQRCSGAAHQCGTLSTPRTAECVHRCSFTSGISLPRRAGVVVVFSEEHNDVDEVAGATSSTARHGKLRIH